eukprot:6619981-Prymnesium_polylepis.3
MEQGRRGPKSPRTTAAPASVVQADVRTSAAHIVACTTARGPAMSAAVCGQPCPCASAGGSEHRIRSASMAAPFSGRHRWRRNVSVCSPGYEDAAHEHGT